MSADPPPYRSPWYQAGSAWAPPREPVRASPGWTERVWPVGPEAPARPATLAAAVAIGAVGALTLRLDAVGSAWLTTSVGLLGVALGARRRRPGAAELSFCALALALVAVAAVRSAPWLVALCLAGAWALAALGLAGARTWTGVSLSPVVPGLAPGRAARWLRPLAAAPRTGRTPAPVALAVAAVTAALLLVFGALFAAADPAFAELLAHALPSTRGDVLARRVFLLCAVTAVTLVAVYLAQRPPVLDALAPAAGKPVRRWAWAVPLALLDLLFATFVAVQLTALFGGREHVARTAGLTYAEYARQGFWQLLTVTALALAVVAGAVRAGPRATAADRALARLLLGPLCLLALVIVGSALHRMSLYEQEFGFTRLRVAVSAAELFLGAVLVLLLLAGVRLRGAWLPRAVAALAAFAVLGLAALDPDAYIAERNVARFEATGRIDVAYLALLSPDAVPALLRLPAGLRACALGGLAPELAASADPWYDANVARSRARRLLAGEELGACRRPAQPAAAAPAASRPPGR